MALNQPLWAKKYKEENSVPDQITITGRQQPMVNATLPAFRTGSTASPIDSTYSTGAGRDGVVQPGRSTGRSMVEMHEGEEVVSNNTVNKMGGNSAVRDVIDRELVRKGMNESQPTGGVPMGKGGTDVYGYQGGGTVVNQPTMMRRPPPTMVSTAPPIETPPPEAPPVEAPTPPAAPPPEAPPAAPPPEAPPPIDQAAVAGMQQEMLTETRDVALGKSKLMESLANQGFQNLGALQQTQLTQTAMQISSNPNLTEGQKRSMMAQTMRQHGIENSEMAGDLAIASMKEARAAQADLFEMTGDIRDFEQQRFQWQQKFDYDKSIDSINAMIDAGDFESAGAAWDTLGVDIDYSKVVDAQTSRIINAGMVNIASNIALGMGMDNEIMARDMETVWEAMNPGETFDPAEGTDSGDWAKKTIDQIKRQGDPIAADIYALTDESISAIVRPDDATEDWSIDDVSYKGLKGRKAAEAALIELKMTGGVTIDEDGNFTTDPDNPLWEILGVTRSTPEGEEEPEAIGYEKYGFTKEEFDDAEVFGKSIFKNGVAYVRTGDDPEDIVSLKDYQENPDIDNDPRFKDDAGNILPEGTRIAIGDQDWKRNKRTGEWNKVKPLSFEEGDNLWGSMANEIIELGKDANPELFETVIQSRVSDMEMSGDYSKLEGLKPGDPMYDGAIASATTFSAAGSYKTAGVENGFYFDDTPPDVGSTISINGKLYVVSEGVRYNEKTIKSEHQYFKVKDPTSKTGAVFTVFPPGVNWRKFGYNVGNSITMEGSV